MSSFALLAELALGLAGFGGVAAAFGGRERAFRPTELIRLRGLILDSAFVLAGCAVVGTLDAAGFSASTTFAAASAAVALLLVVTVVPLAAQTFSNTRAPDTSSRLGSVFVSLAVLVGAGAILLGNALFAALAWPLVASFWAFLLHGLWMFYRVLTRPN